MTQTDGRNDAPGAQPETGVDPIERRRREWQDGEYAAASETVPERKAQFTTLSGEPVAPVYTPSDVTEHDFLRDVGFPGSFPYTRGPYPTMYRARPWTMRQIAGFGTAQDTNSRFKFLIAQGQTGISTDFDMPTLMGIDSDDPRSLGEVGREGVAIDSVEDMRELFDGIDLGRISVSMTINPSAWILLAMYLVVAEERGIPRESLSGTVQADILKEFIAQKEWVYPVRSSMRIVRDLIVYSVRNLPRYNPINVSGYHIREAGSTAVQEVAFTLADGIAYVEEVLAAGLPVDSFAARLAFYFIAERDFFEEIAKFRAARRLWARIMKDRFGAQKAESMRLRFHCQTAGSSLAAKEPLNNVARTSVQALAAVLGGAQSLHTNGWDEALAIPSEHAMKLSLRTQQIILEESGAANTIDPMAGSYFVENLTDRIEEGARDYIAQIDALGGMVAAVEQNFPQREIADAAYRYQRQKDRNEIVLVGVNRYQDVDGDGQSAPFELHKVDSDVEARQIQRVRELRSRRDNARVASALAHLQDVARHEDADEHNLMPPTIEAVRSLATAGEIINALKAVFGTHVEAPVF
ncbi:MAG TPA: methylmalonyl-CoA mutase family protein [Chloroflexota bacterium]|nr:methylmalonyl-CoA mutase family protein [Chloroflexota bacterium]